MQSDKMKIQILPDGTIKTTTDPISGANHENAEDFLKTIARLAGGETVREARSEHGHHHHHSHSEKDHAHEH